MIALIWILIGNRLRRPGADLLTALPHQDVLTWGERLMMPRLAWSVFCLLPAGLAHRLQRLPLSAGIGHRSAGERG